MKDFKVLKLDKDNGKNKWFRKKHHEKRTREQSKLRYKETVRVTPEFTVEESIKYDDEEQQWSYNYWYNRWDGDW